MLKYKKELKVKYKTLEADKPFVEMSRVSAEGTFVLEFTNKMIRPRDILKSEQNNAKGRILTESTEEEEDLSYLKIEEVIDVTYVSNQDDDDDEDFDKELGFDWTIKRYSQYEMEIGITFKNPFLVSVGS